MLRNKAWLIKRYAPTLPNLPAPTAAFDAEPTNCIKINEQWIPMILGALHIFLHEDLFDGDEAARQFVADEAQNLLIAVAHGNSICLEDGMYLLRQSEADGCVLEQSVDGGLSWTEAFDYSKCVLRKSTTDRLIIYQQLQIYNTNMAIVQNSWGGDIVNIAPDMVYDGGSNDDLRDNAACIGLSLLVATFAAQIENGGKTGQIIDDVVEGVVIVSAAGIALASILTGLGTVAIPAWVLSGLEVAATTATVVGAIRAVLGREPELDSVLDEDVQLALLCCGYNALKGGTPDIVTFSQMWDNCDLPGDNDDLLVVMQEFARSETAYIAFVSTMQGIYETLDSGADIACICDDLWVAVVSLEVPALPAIVTLTHGTHQQNVGINQVNWLDGQTRITGITATVNVAAPFSLVACHTIVDIQICAGVGPQTSQGGIATTNKVVSYDFGDILIGNGIQVDGPENDQTTFVQHNIYSCRFNHGGTETLRSIHITGRGDIPPELQAYII